MLVTGPVGDAGTPLTNSWKVLCTAQEFEQPAPLGSVATSGVLYPAPTVAPAGMFTPLTPRPWSRIVMAGSLTYDDPAAPLATSVRAAGVEPAPPMIRPGIAGLRSTYALSPGPGNNWLPEASVARGVLGPVGS